MASRSNTAPVLADLAERINAEHEAARQAVKVGVEHAMKAGELLIQAKEAVPHGEWGPWLKANCSVAPRTAQLYMKLARNYARLRDALGPKNAIVAHFSLNQADHMLNSMTMFLKDPGYDPMHGRTDEEERLWALFLLFGMEELGWNGWDFTQHMEWLLRNGWQTPDDWLGDDEYRNRHGMRHPTCGPAWRAYVERHSNLSLQQVKAEVEERRGPDPDEGVP